MLIKNPKFEISAVTTKQYPNNDLPQIVLVGKSNVGKSSFINTMVNRKKLARTSSEPGKTRLINFYKVKGNYEKNGESTTQEQDFYLVDLPGYGFSKMSKQQQIEVGNFIEEYLVKCTSISLVVFLIDIRHNPTENDKMMYDYIIHQNLPCIIIANKADKIAITKVDEQVSNLQNVLNPLKDLTFLPFSSERKIYVDNAWKNIEYYIK